MNNKLPNSTHRQQLNIVQDARAQLVAGTLTTARNWSYERGYNDWVDILLEDYVCQSHSNKDFQLELASFSAFLEQHLFTEKLPELKTMINADVDLALKAMSTGFMNKVPSAPIKHAA